MSSYKRYALFIDYQQKYLKFLPAKDQQDSKQSACKIADILTLHGHTPIWILMQNYSKDPAQNEPPRFYSPEERIAPDQNERALLRSLSFDPKLILPGEGLFVKASTSAVAEADNPMLSYFQQQATLIGTTLCGNSTTQCIADTACDIPQTPTIHHCTVLIDHLADISAERESKRPPAWHQQKVLTLLADRDKSKFSFLTAQEYLAQLHP